MTDDDRLLLNSVKAQLSAWEDNIENLYGYARGIEIQLLKYMDEQPPASDAQWTEQRLRAVEHRFMMMDQAVEIVKTKCSIPDEVAKDRIENLYGNVANLEKVINYYGHLMSGTDLTLAQLSVESLNSMTEALDEERVMREMSSHVE